MFLTPQRSKSWLWPALLTGLWLTGCADRTAWQAQAEPAPVWAIRCDALRGPDRVALAQARAEALKKVRGLNPKLVQVVHTSDESIVYYGRYKREYDRRSKKSRFKPDPRPDLDLIRSLSITVDGRPVWPFIYATLEEPPAGRSTHPEWDLNNVKQGYWTLHVAVFFNEGPITNRRYLAEEYCRELREQGVEAYYHHGPVRSSVYVGLFPKQAVTTIKEVDPLTGAVTFKNKIVDERLLALQRQFPRSRQNARDVNEIVRDPRTGEIVARLPFRSFIVKIPHAEESEHQPGTGSGRGKP